MTEAYGARVIFRYLEYQTRRACLDRAWHLVSSRGTFCLSHARPACEFPAQGRLFSLPLRWI